MYYFYTSHANTILCEKTTLWKRLTLNGIPTTYLYPLRIEENDAKYKEYIFIIIPNKTIFYDNKWSF